MDGRLIEAPHMRMGLIGGGLVFGGALLSALLIGNIYSDTQARILIEAMAPSAQTLCFAVITASATIITLMLATLSFTYEVDNQFNTHFYRQLNVIALTSSIALVLAVVVLLMLTIPLTEAEALQSWFRMAYYLLIVCVASLSGLIVMIVLMLYKTMKDLIEVVSLSQNGDNAQQQQPHDERIRG